ncbi:MAG: MMPL family transporter [Proteobacteria bacterium]|nr:MMPL family transporter [Pseudomonadota bacterium]
MSETAGYLRARNHIKLVVEHPRAVLAVLLLVTVVLGWRLPTLRFETSIYDMAIEDMPETIRYQSFKKEFGSEEIILIVARADDVFDPATFQQLQSLAGALGRIPGVRRVISLPGVKKEMELGREKSLSDFRALLAPATLFQKNLVSADAKTTGMTLVLDDAADKNHILEAVDDLIDQKRKGIGLYQIGLPVVSRALAEYTARDFVTLPPLAFLVICLVLLYLFRNLLGVLLPALSLLTALAWTFGLMAWTRTPLSMLTMIVPIFLIAVGTAYCMHVLSEYRRTAAEAETSAEAAYRCILATGFPTSLAVVTTVIGLGSLLLNHIPGIREFALLASFGILSMLVILFTLVPACLALAALPEPASRPISDRSDVFDRFLTRVVEINLNHQKFSLPLIAGLTLLALVGASFIRIENNPVNYFKKTTAISRRFHDVYRDLAGSFPINVALTSPEEDYFQNPEHLRMIARLQRFLDGVPGVDKTLSLADYFKLINYATNQYQPAFYRLPEEDFEVRMLKNNLMSMLGRDLFLRFMNPEFSKANIVLRTHISSTRDCLAAQAGILDYARRNLPADLDVEVTGFGVVMAHSTHLLTRGQVQSLSLTLVLVFGIMFLLFLSLRVGLIAMVPNLFPIAVNFGVMGWLGMELSAATSLIAGIAIGLAVDDTIHYLFRYNKEFKKDLDKANALKSTLAHVGRPMVFTTMAISLGFAVVMFSSFKPSSAFGLLMVVTMISALIGDLFLLPALMLHVELITIWDLLKLKLGRDPQEGIPLFQGLKRHQVHYVLLAGALKNLEPGRFLFIKGQTSDSMYAILSGALEVVELVEDEDSPPILGPRKLIARLEAGHVVGEMGMVRSCRRSATVMARTEVELLEVNARMIKRLQWLYPPTAQKFFFNLMTILCDRLENTTQRLTDSTHIDSLTGLIYRPVFLGVLEKEVHRAKRYGSPLSFFIMDLDRFQEINQRFGYEAGDRMLSEIGDLLIRQARLSDVYGRWSGHQFAGILINTPEPAARAATRRLVRILTRHTFPLDGQQVDIQVACGFACLQSGQDESMDGLIQRAADSLEEVKRGRSGTARTP